MRNFADKQAFMQYAICTHFGFQHRMPDRTSVEEWAGIYDDYLSNNAFTPRTETIAQENKNQGETHEK